jgi:hypothetical protein
MLKNRKYVNAESNALDYFSRVYDANFEKKPPQPFHLLMVFQSNKMLRIFEDAGPLLTFDPTIAIKGAEFILFRAVVI